MKKHKELRFYPRVTLGKRNSNMTTKIDNYLWDGLRCQTVSRLEATVKWQLGAYET